MSLRPGVREARSARTSSPVGLSKKALRSATSASGIRDPMIRGSGVPRRTTTAADVRTGMKSLSRVNAHEAAPQQRDADQASDEIGRGSARRGCLRRRPIGEMRCTLSRMDGDKARPWHGYRPGGRQGDGLRKGTDRAIIGVAMVGAARFRATEILQRPARLKPGREQRILRSTGSRRMTEPQNSQSQRDQRCGKAVRKGRSQAHVIPVRLHRSPVKRAASPRGRTRRW
jgi:hypothetical protein